MKMSLKISLIILGIHILFPFWSNAQGFQTQFGKNKVQYEKFEWTFYRDKEFEVYYHQNGRNLAQYVMSHAHEYLEEAQSFLDYKTDQRIVFVIYNTFSDYIQSNLKLVEETYNTGGVTPMLDNIAFVYFDGNHVNFDRRIKAAITEVLLNELMYGTTIQERFQNAALISLPDWFYYGLIAYASKDWDLLKQEQLDKGIKTERYKKFGRLDNYDRIILGYSFWNYIDKAYGKNAISNILYITHVYKNLESGYNFVLGKSFSELYREWYDYYSLELTDRKHNFDDVNEPFNLKKIKKQAEITNIRLNPDGNKIAYVTNDRGKAKIWIYDLEKKRYKKIFKKGYIRADMEKDRTYPLIDWHPRENILTVIYEKKTKIKFFDYNLDKTKKENKKDLDYIEKVLDFSYDFRGQRIVMSAIKNGYSDIFQFEIRSNRFFPVTSDIYDDLNPVYTNDSKGIIFSSNRISDTLFRKRVPAYAPISNTFDVFYFNNFSRDDKLKRLSNTPKLNEMHPQVYDTSYYAYLIDENLITNRNAVRLDSFFDHAQIIANYTDTSRFKPDTFKYKQPDKKLLFIDTALLKDTAVTTFDTALIYRDTAYNYTLTNYPANIHLYNISRSSKKILETFRKDRKYYFSISNYQGNFSETVQKRTFNKDIGNTYEKQRKSDDDFRPNKTQSNAKDAKGYPTTNLTNVNPEIKTADTVHYKYMFVNDFSFVKTDSVQAPKAPVDSVIGLEKIKVQSDENEKESKRYGNASSYFLSFTQDYLDLQFDNSLMGSPYLTYDGNEPLYPFYDVLNLMTKVGLNDLFRDYKLIGAFRIPGDFNGIEYLVSMENDKKRMDKKVTFYRKGENIQDLVSKKRQLNTELRFQLKYPFSEYSAIKLEMFGREDRKITLSSEIATLKVPDVVTDWIGTKTEYIFDNSIPLGMNLFQGTKLKLYFEYFRNYHNPNDQFNVIGGDYRKYIKIHKQIIWANRVAFASSFGDSKIVYFMGGEDGWLFPSFNNQIQVDPEINYVYKSVATNMRGFSQNIRNGNSYALINSELRIPVFKYFFNRPLKSSFFENFQAISFADVGTAWTGSDPYSNENSLYKRIIYNGPLKITVISVGEPIVYGFGFGFRTTVLGYYLKFDQAWGYESGRKIDSVTYLSLGLDF